MRDVATVARGERVDVYAGTVRQGGARFEGFERGQITVDVDNLGTVTFHLGSWFTAVDSAGRELGVVADDPPLVGDPPLLE